MVLILDLKMKEACRICGRELCGNQRRWIFHPTAKLNLQVLLSHALGQDLTRDGRGEFACSKCTFMLDRMYRFDTVIARVEALSIERLQRLLQEKHRLRQCIGGLYRKTNSEEAAVTLTGGDDMAGDGMVDISGLTHAKYCALLQEDLVYSLYESWAEDGLDCHHHHHPQCPTGPGSEATGSHRCAPSTPRRCRGCSHLRVADSDYEAVCKVPRKLARSISCGPSTRYSASVIGGSMAEGGAGGEDKDVEDSDEPASSLTLVPGSQDPSGTSDSDRTLAGRVSSSPSLASLETTEEYIPPSSMTDGLLSSPKEALEDRISDSLFEEPMVDPHDKASPGPSLSLAVCLLQSYAVYRPVRSTKGSKLPVLHRRSPSNGGTRLSFPDPVLVMSYGTPDGERDTHLLTPELETPLIKLNDDMDLDLGLADMEDLKDLYKEYPPPPPHQNLVEEQQSQLNQYECAAGQCVSELQKAQLQVQSLQAKIHESEANNMKLQEKLNEMECELRSLRQAAQSQERTIQGLTKSISTKDSEAQELYQLIEGQNTTLCKLQELAHRNQLSQCKTQAGVSESFALAQLQGELVGVQSSLFSLGLELEASQRSLRQSQRQGDDLLSFKDRLNSDLQEALQHREVTEKHNQDLRCALQKIRSELEAKEAALKESEADKYVVVQEKERSITQLKRSLQDKEQQLQEYSEMLESAGSTKPRDALLDKLRERIKDRDRALERSIDDKFRCLEELESQVRGLQLALREKERDLERLRCILANNEETITSLDGLMRGKELELEQAAEAYRNLQWQKQQSEAKERNALLEKDTIISQLQAALQARSQETQDLTAVLISRVQASPSEVVEELKARLALKEKLFQELLSDRSRQSDEHQAQINDLLNTLGSKDQYLQDYSYRLSLVITERTGQLQELRRLISQKDHELCQLRRDKEKETGAENLLKEKEALIKELMQTREEAVQPLSEDGEAEMKALQEEMRLVLKREKQAQEELSALRSSLSHQRSGGVALTEATDHHCVLEQLVSEYNRLNEALRAEKRLYQSLTQIHKSDSSSEKILALHTELDSVQALRGQLDEVLARTRSLALMLDRAAKTQADFGELSTEEEDEEEGDNEDGSSDEFTDSIEDDEDNVAARSLSSSQAGGPASATGGLLRRTPCQKAEVKQLEDANRNLEVELGEIKSQLEKDGYTSVAQMRSALHRLQQEYEVLRESRERATAEEDYRSLNQEDQEEEEEEDIEEEYEEDEEEELSPVAVGKRGPPSVCLSDEPGKRHCMRPCSLDLKTRTSQLHQPETEAGLAGDGEAGVLWRDIEEGLREQAARLRSDLTLSHQDNRELQERLMVSEATVHAQAEQLKDYRELLTETSVQQASKQVQVDLQDLGYETCGRSENEAEREDASSPEFDDLEMCTSLSHHQAGQAASGGWYSGDVSSNLETVEESSSLQQLVQDLRSQLTHCHKVIRGLQLRVRSLSITSDYASSLERTPRKVNWAFATSPAPSTLEEDEGWMSDTQAIRSEPKPSTELQALVARVASLEAQLSSSKNQAEEGKCATWPGKYSTLIQTQARELSHFRQRMKEGQGVGHILTQHLGDTTKAFEELLRANDIDYYMGQSFREQLAQSTALAQRVLTKISGREHTESHDDKAGHELLALRLSKELQEKDKIIESLHIKLQQRPETPSSCHALSETTDHSDRTSLMSDEYQATEDADLCSDLDSKEFQEERRLQEPGLEPRLVPEPCGVPTNIYIQGLDSVTQLSNEIRILKEENVALQSRLQVSSDTSEEVVQLREAVFTARARLKQSELEAEQWKEELRRLQAHSQEQGQQIHTLRQERQAVQEKNNRLQHEVSLLQQQLCESRNFIHSLHSELHVYDRVCSGTQANKGYLCEVPGLPLDLGELLDEVRSLRAQLQNSVQENSALKQLELHKQLEQKLCGGSPRTPSLSALTASPQRESFYRRQLIHDPAPSPPVRDIGLFNCGSPGALYSDLDDSQSTANDPLDPHSDLEGEAPDGSYANRNGRHAIGHIDDFSALQQQILEGQSLIQHMETTLQACLGPPLLEGRQTQSGEPLLDYACVKSLLSNTTTLRQIVEEAISLLKMFWRAALPDTDPSIQNIKKEQCMQEEILSLKLRISEQEEVLKESIQRLRSTSRTKKSMEHFIVSQLSRTRDVLKKARTNLELRTQEALPETSLMIAVT